MKKSYTEKVELFKRCIDATETLRSAAILAHRKHGLNAADCEGGIGSDQAAWQEAAGTEESVKVANE